MHSHLRGAVSTGVYSFPNRIMISTNDSFNDSIADKWATAARFYNCCGPTEVTIANTMIAHTPGHTLSIGRPTPNNNVYILDDDEKPVPIGRPGVMWGGGAGIAKGYVDLPDKTAEKFRYDKFANDGLVLSTFITCETY
jgi:non-ribosomal peptide synthetase component F